MLRGGFALALGLPAGSTVIASDNDASKKPWRALSAAEPGYSSPIICDAGGQRQGITVFADQNVCQQSRRWQAPVPGSSGSASTQLVVGNPCILLK